MYTSKSDMYEYRYQYTKNYLAILVDTREQVCVSKSESILNIVLNMYENRQMVV